MARKRKMKVPYPACIIKWVDSTYKEDDTGATVQFRPDNVLSIAWLIREEKDHYVIAKECELHTPWIRRVTSIPKCAVKLYIVWDEEVDD